MRRTIAAVAFSAIVTLSFAADTANALAANTTQSHGAQVERDGGRGSGTTSPFDALGITWE